MVTDEKYSLCGVYLAHYIDPTFPALQVEQSWHECGLVGTGQSLVNQAIVPTLIKSNIINNKKV